MKPIFSVCVIIKNEEESLTGLFESLKEFSKTGGDIIIVDTGSTDASIRICRNNNREVWECGDRFLRTITEEQSIAINADLLANGEEPIVSAGDKVFDFAAARNFAATTANVMSNDWIMYLDADERFVGDLDAIQKEMTVGRGLLRTWIRAGKTEWLTTRIYDRRKYAFEGICHEGLYATAPSYETTIPKEVLCIDHQQLPKEERPTRIKGLALQALTDKSPRWQHYYGRELAWRGRYKTAIKVLEAHAFQKHWVPEAAESLAIAGDCYRAIGEVEKARDSWQRCYSTDPKRRVGLMRLAEEAFSRADWPMVKIYAEQALTIPMGTYIENKDEYGYRPHWLLYPALWQLGDIVDSEDHYAEALRLSPEDGKILSDYKFYHPL